MRTLPTFADFALGKEGMWVRGEGGHSTIKAGLTEIAPFYAFSSLKHA